jgi:hypothetical protein
MPPQTQGGMKNTGQFVAVDCCKWTVVVGGAWACTVLQAPEMHDGGANFVMKIELRGHLTRVIEVDPRVARVAKEQGAAGKFFTEANLRPTECQ